MLKCKNCGHPYSDDKNFCDQCGNPLPPIEKAEEGMQKKWISCPTCKRKIVDTTTICPFCGEDINLGKLIEAAVARNKNKSYAIIGFILGLSSLPMLFFSPVASLVIGVLGLIMSLFGIQAKKKLGIMGSVVSSFGVVITVLLLTLVIGFQFQSHFFSWSMRTIEDEIQNLSDNSKYKKEIYTSWEQVDGTNLLVLDEASAYEWYEDKNYLDNNYMKGIFLLDNGVSMSSGMLYEDSSYYYYQLTLIKLDASVNGEFQQRNVGETIYTLSLSKITRNYMCLENIESGVKTCFNKLGKEVTS